MVHGRLLPRPSLGTQSPQPKQSPKAFPVTRAQTLRHQARWNESQRLEKNLFITLWHLPRRHSRLPKALQHQDPPLVRIRILSVPYQALHGEEVQARLTVEGAHQWDELHWRDGQVDVCKDHEWRVSLWVQAHVREDARKDVREWRVRGTNF